MRGKEHLKVFTSLMPELNAYCRAGLTGYIAREDKAVLSEDIVQMAGIVSLAYCTRPPYENNYPLDKLIWEVTKSVLSRFQRRGKKQKEITDVGPTQLNQFSGSDALDDITSREDLARLREFANDDSTLLAIAKRDEGMDDCDIANELGITEVALRQRISRLVKKIKEKWPTRGDM